MIEDESAPPKRIALIQISDSQEEPRGGMDSYMRGLGNALEGHGIEVWKVDLAISKPRRTEREIVIADHRVSNYMAPLFLLRAALRMRRGRDWVIHAQRPEQLIPFRLVAGRKWPFVLTISGPIRRAIVNVKSRPVAALYSLIEMVGFRIADAVIFVDNGTSALYTRAYPWLARKSYIIPVGVGPEYFGSRLTEGEAKGRFGFRADERIVCFVGRLGQEKNVDLVLRSFARISEEEKNLRLAIAGDGDQRMMLEQLSKDLGIADRVTFLGRLPHSGIMDLLSASAVLVLASKWEGSPTVVREALASRTRVVSTNVGDVKELIRDESVGIIIPEATEQALAEGVRSALGKERQTEIRPFIREFCWDKMSESIIAIYYNLEAEKNKRD